MRVVSWNVNGIRACVRHGFVDFVDRSGADIVGVQEVRARPEDIPPAARRLPGWHTAFTVAERRGYSGVGLYSKQLRLYALALENPPLLIVSDMLRFRIRTNWTNSVSKTYEFGLDDLADAATRDRLKWVFSDPERLRPGETRQSLTERVAASFAKLAQALRERGHDPHAVAHFVNRLVFCMFADDVDLLPGQMFTRMLEQARRTPAHFADLAGDLFRVMASGGRVGFETVDWFNGGLFDDATVLPLEKADIDTVLAASNLDWSEIDPSIVGTLFERGLDPGKRAQLGAHYTDRDKIMLIVEPVVIRPWLTEWATEKAEIAAELARAEAAKSPAARKKRRKEAERRYRAFLNRLRAFTVLDPACGSGNFLYLALQALKDLEHRVQFEAEVLGFERQFSVIIGPANVKGIEINPYAAESARVSVWIGEIQWMRRNGFAEARVVRYGAMVTARCSGNKYRISSHWMRRTSLPAPCRWNVSGTPVRQARTLSCAVTTDGTHPPVEKASPREPSSSSPARPVRRTGPSTRRRAGATLWAWCRVGPVAQPPAPRSRPARTAPSAATTTLSVAIATATPSATRAAISSRAARTRTGCRPRATRTPSPTVRLTVTPSVAARIRMGSRPPATRTLSREAAVIPMEPQYRVNTPMTSPPTRARGSFMQTRGTTSPSTPRHLGRPPARALEQPLA